MPLAIIWGALKVVIEVGAGLYLVQSLLRNHSLFRVPQDVAACLSR